MTAQSHQCECVVLICIGQKHLLTAEGKLENADMLKVSTFLLTRKGDFESTFLSLHPGISFVSHIAF